MVSTPINGSAFNSDAPTLTLQDSLGNIQEFTLLTPRTVIGRDNDCDIVIKEINVSRQHAAITINENGIFIEDLGSANGTFLNTTPVTNPVNLKHSDVIQIGTSMLVLAAPNLPLNVNLLSNNDISNNDNFNFATLKNIINQLEENISQVFKGKPEVLRNLIVCLLADGHILLEDVPGVGKSILAQALAKSIQAKYSRIQFTPDMLPGDITGVNIFDDMEHHFRFIPGPIFGNVILADEINRATPRTQSSLLECMSESAVTVDGKSHMLPKPFFVIATQNPNDYHGTYPLPEPQLDRFLMSLSIGYPNEEAELDILSSQEKGNPLTQISYVIKGSDVVHCHALVRSVTVCDEIKNYIIAISNATRVHPALCCGCSPRASLALMRSCQSLAAYYGRNYVTPDDVKEMAKVVLPHRLKLKLRQQSQWQSPSKVIDAIINDISFSAGVI